MWLLLIAKYMGIQGAKSEKRDAEAPNPAIRIQILYESDPTLHLSIVLIVSRNGEPSLMLSTTTKTHRICIYPINTKLRNLQTISKIRLRTIRLRLKSRKLSLLYKRNILNIFIISSLILRIAEITYI